MTITVKSDLWVSHYSVEPSLAPSNWAVFLEEAQLTLGCTLTHADSNDPIRRKVASPTEAGAMICQLKAAEDDKWTFIKFSDKNIHLTVLLNKKGVARISMLQWRFASPFAEKAGAFEKLETLFALGNEHFRSFYAYADALSDISKKNRPRGSIDVQAELLGVCWLTYFNSAYLNFFGASKFADLEYVSSAQNGVSLKLGDKPSAVDSVLREHIESLIGKQSFVDPHDTSPIAKQRGRFALTIKQLLEQGRPAAN